MLRHLEIAHTLGLPVIIHNRNAGRTLGILRAQLPQGGILHCYTEDWAFAKKALDLNLSFSFAGNLTFRTSRLLHEVASRLPWSGSSSKARRRS